MTILIAWEHGANLGHLARLIPVANGLRQSGQAVLFAVPGTQRASNAHTQLQAAALPWFGLPMVGRFVLPPPPAGVVIDDAAARLPVNHADILLRCGFGDPPAALACVQHWLRVFERVRPQAVLVDASPFALYAAKVAGLPVIALGHGFELPPLQQPGPCFAPLQPDIIKRAEAAESNLAQVLAALAQHPGVDGHTAPSSLADLFSPSSSALCTWPELDHFDRDATVYRYHGPIWQAPVGATTLAWPDKPGPKVLCYVNVRDWRYDLLWQALTRLGANVLVLSPAGIALACDAVRGWGITVVEHPVSLNALLPASDAVIAHGGMGLTGMALHAGKPLMLLPEQVEQRILAERLEQRRLAVATTRLRHKAGIQNKVEQLLQDPALKAATAQLAGSYEGFTPGQAVDGVLAQLRLQGQ